VPIKDNPAMQSWTDGLVAVLDAVGSEHRVDICRHGSRAACHDVGRQPSTARPLPHTLEHIRAVPLPPPTSHSAFPEPKRDAFLESFWWKLWVTGATIMDRARAELVR